MAVAQLPPKLVEIDTQPAVPVFEVEDYGEGAGPRIQRARAAIASAAFTSEGDKSTVLGLYNDYVTVLGNAMNDAGEVVAGSERRSSSPPKRHAHPLQHAPREWMGWGGT